MSEVALQLGRGHKVMETTVNGSHLGVSINDALNRYFDMTANPSAERYGDGVQRATLSYNDWANMHPDAKSIVMKVALRDSANAIFRTYLPIEYTDAGIIRTERILFKSEPVMPKARGTLADLITHTTDSREGRIVHSALGVMQDLHTADKAEAIQMYQRNIQRVMVAIWHAVVLDAYNAGMEHISEYKMPEQNWGGGRVPETPEEWLDYMSTRYALFNKCPGAFSRLANFASGITEQLSGQVGVALMTSKMLSYITYRDQMKSDPTLVGQKRSLELMNKVTAASDLSPDKSSGIEKIAIPRVSNDKLHGDISGDVFAKLSVIGSHWTHRDNYYDVPPAEFRSTMQDVYVPSARTSDWDRYSLAKSLHSCATFVPLNSDIKTTGRTVSGNKEGRVNFDRIENLAVKYLPGGKHKKTGVNYTDSVHGDMLDVGVNRVPPSAEKGYTDGIDFYGIYVIGQLNDRTPDSHLMYIGDVIFERVKAKIPNYDSMEEGKRIEAVGNMMCVMFPSTEYNFDKFRMRTEVEYTKQVETTIYRIAEDENGNKIQTPEERVLNLVYRELTDAAYNQGSEFDSFDRYIDARPRDFMVGYPSVFNRRMENAANMTNKARGTVQKLLLLMDFSLQTFDLFDKHNIPIPIFAAYFRPNEARLQESVVFGTKSRWGTTYIDEKGFDEIVCDDTSRKEFKGYRLGHLTMIHNPECLNVQLNVMGGQYVGGCGNMIMHEGLDKELTPNEWRNMTRRIGNPEEMGDKCIIVTAISYTDMKEMPRWLDLRGAFKSCDFPHISRNADFNKTNPAPMYGGQFGVIENFSIETQAADSEYMERRSATQIAEQLARNFICGQAGSRHYSHHAADHIMYRQPHHMMQEHRDTGMQDLESSNVSAPHIFTPGVAKNMYVNHDTSSTTARNFQRGAPTAVRG